MKRIRMLHTLHWFMYGTYGTHLDIVKLYAKINPYSPLLAIIPVLAMGDYNYG